MTKQKSLSKGIWFNLILFGFMGQIAWAVENIYFNTYLFNYIGGDTSDISLMVSLSAVTAVLTTFIMGTLSDKLNKRKVFISAGYIAWGLTVAVFAFISRENVGRAFGISDQAKVLVATVSIVIVMDCIMTFMGSTSNDAAFNAWITDITDTNNRGVAESVLSLMPLFAMLIVSVGFGAGVSAVGYPMCFLVLGGLVTICGILGLFTVKDSRNGIKSDSNYFKDIVYGFKPSVVKSNKDLYIALAAIAIFNCAVQIFMPYIFIYVQHFIGLDFNNIGALLTPGVLLAVICGIVGAVVAVILFGKGVDKFGKSKFVFASIVLFAVGLVLLLLTRKLSHFLLSLIVMILGYAMLMIILNASVRDFTPEDKAGLFQGVRMIFAVLIPMVTGPSIGAFIIKHYSAIHEGAMYINDYGESVSVPVPEIFLAAAIVNLLIIAPAIYLKKKLK